MSFREYLTEWLMSVGPVLGGGMGPVAVPHSELLAWAANTGLDFRGAEAEWLNKMSAAYAQEIGRSDDADASAPFTKD